ncbi:hypothetical protein F5Y08DRAFT_337796 [Xylaria arbuscula]|nr:hypothetical protein F5Y08DRAFT_337796 [Xylaria arbuscula]
MTNLGPLTTTFTPQGPDCSSTFLGRDSTNQWLQYGIGGSSSSACYPDDFRPLDVYYYSPGICPSGYTTACTAQVALSGNKFEDQYTCCPESYTCDVNRPSNVSWACRSMFKGPKTFEVNLFSFQTDSAASTSKVISSTASLVVTSNWLLAYGPIIFPQKTDVANTSASIDSASTTINIATSTSSRNVSTTTSPAKTSSPTGLGRGAIAGISVGSVVAGVLLIGAIALLVSRRWKRSANAKSTRVETESELHSESLQPTQYRDIPQHKLGPSSEGNLAQFHELDAE